MNLKNTLLSILIACTFINISNAQNSEILSPGDYFLNGKGEMEKFLTQNMKYPPDAMFNSIAGLSVVSFKIDCVNEPSDIRFETTLGYGFEEAVKDALLLTKGKWSDCNEISNNGRVSVKIAFSINNVFLPVDADVYVNIIEEGNLIMDDRTLVEKVNDNVKKEKYAKAKKYLELLILRYPYNEDYKKLMHQLDGKI